MNRITLFFAFLLFLTGCSETVEYIYPLELTTRLKDQGTLQVQLKVELENQAGLDEIKAKTPRIQRAFSLVFREYTLAKLKGPQTVTRVMNMIFDSQVKNIIVKFEVTDYQALPRNAQKT